MYKQLLGASLALAVSAGCYAGGIETVSPSNPAANFSGVSLGAGVGFSDQFIKHEIFDQPRRLGTRSTERTLGALGAALEGFAGYNYQINEHWLLGYFLSGEYDTNSGTSYYERGALDVNGTLDITWQVNANLQLGYAPFERNMFYIGVGPTWANLDHKRVVDGSTDVDHNHKIWGGRGVLGARQALSEHWILGEEVNYTYFAPATMNHLADDGSSTYWPQVVTALVTLSYRFA